MMYQRITRFFSAILLFSTLGALGNTAQATQDGTYVGTVPMDINCSSPSAGPFNFSASMVATISGSNITLGVADATSTFIFGGSGTYSGGTANVTGNLATSGIDSNIDGAYSPASFNLTVTYTGSSLSVSGSGQALSGPGVCSILSYGLTSSATLTLVSGEVFNPEETTGTRATDPIVLATGLRQDVNTFSNRSNFVMRGNGNGFQQNGVTGLMYGLSGGLNAGDDPLTYGAWISYNYTDFDYEFSPLAFEGARHSVLFGLDVSPWQNTVLGLSFGIDESDIDTTFNGGEQESRGFTVASYFGALLTETFSVDATIGITSVDTNQFRTAGATKITSNPDGKRYFGAFNVNGIWFRDNWIFGAKTGLLFARSEQDGFTESNATVVAASSTKLNQWNIGADAAYSFGEWEPFGRVSYENDFSQTTVSIVGASQPKNDDDSLVMGVGVRWFGASGLTGNFELSRRLGKADFDESSLNFTIRGEF